jgi:hypothetical protein
MHDSIHFQWMKRGHGALRLTQLRIAGRKANSSMKQKKSRRRLNQQRNVHTQDDRGACGVGESTRGSQQNKIDQRDQARRDASGDQDVVDTVAGRQFR